MPVVRACVCVFERERDERERKGGRELRERGDERQSECVYL